MKRYLPLGLLLLAFVYMSSTGFQCGSAETTSAKLYMNQKQWDKAEASLLKEVAKNDKNEEAWFLLGQTRLEMKKYAEMNEAYTKALQVSDVHKADIQRNRLAIWAMMYNDGVGLYNKGRDSSGYYQKAIDRFSTAIDMVPDSSGTYYVRALAYYAQQNMKAALGDLDQAVKMKPDFEEAARLAGQVHYNMGIERSTAKDDAGAQAELLLATQSFEKAYKANPGNPDNITNLIDVYERTKNADKALALTQNAVEKDPNNKVFRYAFGVFLLKQDKFPEAIEQFKKATEIDPRYSDAVYNLGVSYLNWGVSMKTESDKKADAERLQNKGKDVKEDISYKEKFKEALPFLEKAQEMRTDDLGLLQQLGKLYANLNMVDKSKAAFEKYDRLTKGK
jgi:tetratricopeptide (TPR) repeat protein